MRKLLLFTLAFIFTAAAFAQHGADKAFNNEFAGVEKALTKKQLKKQQQAEWGALYTELQQEIKKYGYFDYKKLEGGTIKNYSKKMQAAINDFVAESAKTAVPANYDFDYSSIIPADTKIILAGEYHRHGTEVIIADMLLNLRDNINLKTLAAEHYSSADQQWLNKVSLGGYDFHPYTDPALKLMLNAAEGLNIVGIEPPFIEETVDIMNYRPINRRNPVMRGILTPVTIAGRHTYWINAIKPYIPQGPLLLYGGAIHMLQGEQAYNLPAYFNKNGDGIISIVFVSSDNSLFEQSLKHYDFNKSYLYILKVTDEKKPEIGADYIILHSR